MVALSSDSIDKKALDEIGFLVKTFINKPVNFVAVQLLKEKLVRYYENNGYPFAAVYLDNVQLDSGHVKAAVKVKKGPLYLLDSIRVYGKVKIANSFLQRYLSIPNGSLYSREKLELVNKRLLELPYLQEEQAAEVTLLGTGSLLNLYLKPKRSSQVNFLIGFLPANNQTNKLQLTGDVNLNLKNPFGKGETVIVNWQQLQLNSPRLHIGYQHPYLFKSPFGIDFSFELFKKDSSFLQLNATLGLQYLLSANQTGKLFFQQQSTTLLGEGVDTNQLKITKRLPPNIDVKATSVGIDYEWNKTNYRLNPRTGNELKLMASVGMKTISKNNDIVNLVENGFDYNSLYDSLKLKTYQLRATVAAAHYFAAGKRSTLKAALHAGVFSSQSIFRNELFQIGGYKLLRGFDEESIFATRYGVLSAEFRYLAGLNSYLFCFTDAGWVRNKYQTVDVGNSYISAGLGLVFETKAGLLNMSFAVGKSNNIPFDLRKGAKIHFGYINYF
jgi:outer membrane protein assembly factor BamA